MKSFYHSGDLGDIIASLPTVRELGGGDYVIGPGMCRESLAGARFQSIVELLLAQPYIDSVHWVDQKPTGMDVDFSTFRECDYRHGEDLATWQARHVGVLVELEPWLEVDAGKHGKPVFARSPRYHNDEFPWRQIVRENPDALFVGTETEHQMFELENRGDVHHAKTKDLYEVAQVIAGASRFYGNQSCPWWIAFGLGQACTQETRLDIPNSIIRAPHANYPMVNEFPKAARFEPQKLGTG